MTASRTLDLEACAFTTERTAVEAWSRHDDGVVVSVLTEPVTRHLPPDWQGPYDEGRAHRWVRERRAEGALLVVNDRESNAGIGFVLLAEVGGDAEERAELRFGYLLAERAWGRGLGTELLAGLVAWCRGNLPPLTLVGGVAHDNLASCRVLEKTGFVAAERSDGEQFYRLELGPGA